MLAAAVPPAWPVRHGPLLALLCLVAACGFGPSGRAATLEDKLSAYRFEDTRQLVAMVEAAADLVARDGTAAFPQFAVAGSRWFHDNLYIFIFAVDGTCVFHAASPGLVGRNLMDFRDIHEKPVIRLITDVAKLPGPDAADWVFYLWEEDKPQLDPQWKSAYVRKAVAPDGKIYLVGSGSYDIKVEEAFITDNVRHAADLIQSAGKEAAFRAFRDPASSFVFLDTYIFVLDEKGRLLVDPAYPTLAGRDLDGFQDAMGVSVIQALIAKLQQHDEAAVQYLWARPGRATLSRKLIYARRVRVGGESMIVGSDFFLATPIWMKSGIETGWPSVPPA
jgi:hypothetical protein